MRTDGRSASELRKIRMVSGVNPYAEGSCQVSFGRTTVLCTATVEKEVPKWMEEGAATGGWITAEYGMLPRSTHTRTKREAAHGKQGGRTLEIQRLIGRALRQAVSLEALGQVTIRLDCDVLCADGGTRTAAVSGAWVALAQAIEWGKCEGVFATSLALTPVAAVSVGRVGGTALLDLCYSEDATAEFDLNVVANVRGELIEVQGTGERTALPVPGFLALVELAQQGISEIIAMQRAVVGA